MNSTHDSKAAAIIRWACVSVMATGLLAAAVVARGQPATTGRKPAAVVRSQPATARPAVRLPPELARVLTDYEKAWAARDPAALARLFTEDGWVLSSGSPPVQGRPSIERHYKGQGGPLSLRPFFFASNGDLAHILGGYGPSPEAEEDGKFTLTLRKVGPRWLINSDMDNPNRRPR
jgi:ketosteroid isomerase-like protein